VLCSNKGYKLPFIHVVRSRSKSRERDRERGGRREERPAATSRDHPQQQQEDEEQKFGMRLAALKQEEGANKGEKPKEGVNLGLSGALTEVRILFRLCNGAWYNTSICFTIWVLVCRTFRGYLVRKFKPNFN
jgi:hypothetical protein